MDIILHTLISVRICPANIIPRNSYVSATPSSVFSIFQNQNNMWKAAAGHDVDNGGNGADDDWETDPDFINDVSEQEQRWGSKTIQGSGRTAGTIE